MAWGWVHVHFWVNYSFKGLLGFYVIFSGTKILIFLFQIANHSGYVQVDWRKVEKDVNKAKKHLKKNANKAAPELNSFIEEVGIISYIHHNFIVY